MKNLKRLWFILKRTGTLKILLHFLVMSVVVAVILRYVEDDIQTVGDGLWYTFVAATTIGFGDFYATTLIGRVLTVFISFHGIVVFAMITGVVVNYYTEYLNHKKEETISLFLEKLEDLPDLSKTELKEISEQVKKIKNN